MNNPILDPGDNGNLSEEAEQAVSPSSLSHDAPITYLPDKTRSLGTPEVQMPSTL